MASIGTAALGMLGKTEKAVLEIASFVKQETEENEAAKPSAGAGFGKDFNLGRIKDSSLSKVVSSFAGIDIKADGDNTEAFNTGKKFRFEVQFNPEELYINGYGGEELPIQDFQNKQPGGQNPQGNEGQKKKPHEIVRSSRMAAADTRIEMSVKLIFDKTDNQDAFYSDKFTLSQTSIGKGALKLGKKAITGSTNSVQEEVEALTAVCRDTRKRLASFVWGDMIYEGTINSVTAEYVMFNINGEPCRAYVTIGMVLYDQNELGAEMTVWKDEYENAFSDNKNVADRLGNLNVAL